MKKIVVDLDSVMKPCKPYADNTLQNMKKSELIEYVRILENNCDVAVAALNQQAENVKDWEPVKHGHWDEIEDDFRTDFCYECSNCGKEWRVEDGTPEENNMNYCPNCGAKMNEDG